MPTLYIERDIKKELRTEVIGRFEVERLSVRNYDSSELQIKINEDGDITITVFERVV